jgi:hypothetical protein
MTSPQTPSDLNDLFKQAVETFQTAVRTGVKLQEESTRRFTTLLRDFGSPLEWQKNAQQMMSESIEATQKGIEESIRMVNQNAQTAMAMMQKAFETQPTNGAPEVKPEEIWDTALGALRSNAQVVLEANSRLVESWTQLVKESMSKAQNGVHHAAEQAANSV